MTDKEVMLMALDALELLNGAETTEGIFIYTDKEIEALRTALAQLEKTDIQIGITYEEANPPEPYCKRCGKKLGTEAYDVHTCTPIKKEWVGLTDEEAGKLWESTDSDWELMKRVEAKLKDKNNG